jgi:hypothetical protein
MGSDLLISSIHLRPNGVLNISSKVFIYYRALHSSPTHLLDTFYLKAEGKYSHVTAKNVDNCRSISVSFVLFAIRLFQISLSTPYRRIRALNLFNQIRIGIFPFAQIGVKVYHMGMMYK